VAHKNLADLSLIKFHNITESYHNVAHKTLVEFESNKVLQRATVSKHGSYEL
jgi:hypothetical protein